MSARKKKHRQKRDESASPSDEDVLFESVRLAPVRFRYNNFHSENSSVDHLCRQLQNNVLLLGNRLQRRTATDNQAKPHEKKVKDILDKEANGKEYGVRKRKPKENKSKLGKEEFKVIKSARESEEKKGVKSKKRTSDNVNGETSLLVMLMELALLAGVLLCIILRPGESAVPECYRMLLAAAFTLVIFYRTVVCLRNMWTKMLLKMGKLDVCLHQHPSDDVEIKAKHSTKEKPRKSSDRSLRVAMMKRDKSSCDESTSEQEFEETDLSDEEDEDEEYEDDLSDEEDEYETDEEY